MQTAREIDNNGYLTIKGCPISSFGIFDYSAGQVGLPGDPNRIVKVYRPESAVNNQEAMRSFMNVPFIDDHEMLSGFAGDEENTAPEAYGVDGVLTGNVYFEKPWMRGDLKVFSRRLRQAIDSGKVDLSLGYGCDFIVQSGEFEGQPYEVIQTNLRGNHIALVESGRVPGARVLDGRCFDHLCLTTVTPSTEESTMPKPLNKSARDNAVEQLKSLIPALEQFLNAEGQQADNPGAAVPPEGEAQQKDAEVSSGENATASPEQAVAAVAVPEENSDVPSDPENTEAAGDLPQLISQLESLLAQLKGGAAKDEDVPGEKANDAIEGIHNGGGTGSLSSLEKDDEPTKAEKASPGPTKGEHAMASDAAIGAFYSDLARKDSLYKRLSKVVGAFDHSAMDAKGVAKYGVKKIGLSCKDGAEFDSLDNYLRGVEQGAQATVATVKKQAADSAADTAELDKWLKGE